MGSGHSKLSEPLKEEVIAVFKKIDKDGSNSIDKDETLKYWSSNFAKLNTEALFKSVDKDANGSISIEEWLGFWEEVKRAGHTEEEIQDELRNLTEGKAWVYFDKVPSEQKVLKNEKMIKSKNKNY